MTMASSAQLLSLLTRHWTGRTSAAGPNPPQRRPVPEPQLKHRAGTAAGGEPQAPPRLPKRRRTSSHVPSAGDRWHSGSPTGDAETGGAAGESERAATTTRLPAWVLPSVRLRSVAPSVVRLLDMDHAAGRAPPRPLTQTSGDAELVGAPGAAPPGSGTAPGSAPERDVDSGAGSLERRPAPKRRHD